MGLYIGESDTTMDEKNRLTVPKKFRAEFPNPNDPITFIWVVRAYDESDFVIMDDPTFQVWLKRFSGAGVGPSEGARAKTLLGSTERIQVDRNGRALLPQKFLERCGIGSREFTMCGAFDYIQVFQRDRHESFVAEQGKEDVKALWQQGASLERGEPKEEIGAEPEAQHSEG